MSSIEEFESILKELPTLKAPGVSGSRIKKLTDIAFKEISQESKLITTLYSNCKAAPSTHKLGTLYVVDSIVRGFLEEARKENQEINSSAPEGTFASAVFKISELIESLVDDALELSISNSQNIKISKLVDIWERGNTFSPEIIKRIRDKHFASTTPPGSPPRRKIEPVKPVGDGGAKDSNSILSALASLAKSNSASSTPQGQNTQPVSNNDAGNILSQLSALSGTSAASNVSSAVPPNLPQPPTNYQQKPPHSAPATANNEQLIFNMLQQMQSGGGQIPPQQMAPQPQINDYSTGRRSRDSQDSNGYGRRNRSRSPNRGVPSNQYIRTRSPPPPRVSSHNPHLPPNPLQQIQQHRQQQQQLQQQQHQPQYQQQHHQQQQMQQQQDLDEVVHGGELNIPGSEHYRPRNVGFDATLPQGSFKVLSRTLFIGGVPRHMDERALADALRPFAEVQSVILNSERKHAFIKVYSRREAEQVVTSFNKDNSLPLRTRWGVGFGPRDCCNYQHGISIIPIQRLTDADRSWVVQAQWGGTGGQPLSSGMVIDEPDIEIGSGISSKAMSKKMPTNSARNGPKSNRPGEPDEEYVKTTLIPQDKIQMSHGAQPDFNTFQQSSVNPLQGLFNSAPQQQQPNLPSYPAPVSGGMQAPPAGFNDFMMQQQQQGGNNPNLAALAQLLQQQQQQQRR
ncbi:Protein NRD1 [Spathaspora sp. JA1]|nr:Protein NRD1 [Spathaspora sp. JA1]